VVEVVIDQEVKRLKSMINPKKKENLHPSLGKRKGRIRLYVC
jgi:hypothetical protein